MKILINSRKISEEDLVQALTEQCEKPQRLGEILVAVGRARREDVAAVITENQEVAYATCRPRASPARSSS